MNKLIALCLALTAFCRADAQAPAFTWAQRTGGYNTAFSDAGISVIDMRLSRAGQLITVGNYSGKVDFDPGPGVDTLGSFCNYLSKTDTAGNHLWVRKILPGASIQRMALDNAGNIFLTGYFSGTLDLDPGPAVHNITANGASGDIFVCKLDTAGNYLWGHAIGDAGNDWSRSICVDLQDNVYLTGFINGTVDMDPGPGTTTLTTQNDDPFILKLNADGSFAWARNISGSYNDQGRDIAVDAQGNVYVTGSFTGTADFDPGPATYNLTTSIYSRNAFLLKLNSSGLFTWAYSFGDPNDDWGDNVSVDRNGNPVITGYFSSVMDCDPGPGSYVLTPNYFQDFFAIKLTAAGSFLWARKFGLAASGYTQYLPAIRHSLDSAGNVFITGNFRDTADFNPGPGVKELTTVWDGTTFDWGSFLLLLDNNGDYKWAAGFGQGGQGNWGTAVQADDRGHIYAAGTFNDTIDFDPGPAISLLQTPPTQFGTYGVSAYLLKMGPCFATTGTYTTTACKQYVLEGQAYTQSGIYTQTLMNYAGCDSILTLHLTINKVDTQVIQYDKILTALPGADAYQWIRCGTMSPVAGATQQQFLAPANGDYAVIITKNGCTDTSACHHIGPLGIGNLQGANGGLSISPNPVLQDLQLKGRHLAMAGVYDLQGKCLLQLPIGGRDEAVLHLGELAPGLYLLKVVDEEGQLITAKVTKL